jgi:hypothetical protein
VSVFLQDLIKKKYSGKLFYDYWRDPDTKTKSFDAFKQLTDSQMTAVIENIQ